MTLRDQVMAAVRGEKTDRVPFTCYKSLLPEGGGEIENLALIYTASCFHVEQPGVSVTSRELEPGVRESTLHTPWGELTQISHTETGYGSSWTREHWIKRAEDYGVIEQVMRNTRIVPDPTTYERVVADIGDRGVAMAAMHRTPFQRLWIEYVGMERLAFDLIDHPEAVEACLDAMMEQAREVMKAAAQGPAELVWAPDNITGEMTGPPMFERYLLAYYREVCDTLLPAGKLPCCHMDGMLRQVADCIGQTDLPVMEAFTPPPDGNLSVREAREAWPEKTLWLNFPSSIHLAPPGEIARVTEGLVAEAGDRGGFLIGVTENIPGDVGARSLQAIGEVLA